MPSSFNSAAGSQRTTTAGELAEELGRFAKSLGEQAQTLRSELEQMGAARSGIKDEADHTARLFASQTVTELDGDGFDTMAEIAQGVEELGSQGLVFFRHKLVTARDEALQAVNDTLKKTVSAEEFQSALAEAEAAHEAANAAEVDAHKVVKAAQKELADWESTSLEDDIVRLDEDMKKNGEFSLSSEQRGQYEPGNALVAAYKWMFGGETYRKVRTLLLAYGHGENGKDAFADLTNFRKKYETFNGAIAQAKAVHDAAQATLKSAAATKDRFIAVAAQIKTDGQILGDIHGKVSTDMQESPALIKALSAHYQEDFPKALPLLVTKISVLDRIRNGTQARLEAIQLSYQKVTEQFRKMSSVRGTTKIKGDLEAMKKEHAQRLEANEHYTEAAGRSWRQTRDYTLLDGVIVGELASGALESGLLQALLGGPGKGGAFEAAKDAGYTANLLGIDKAAAEKMNLPEEVVKDAPAADTGGGLDDDKFDIVRAPKSAAVDTDGMGDAAADVEAPDVDVPDVGGGFEFPDIDLDIF